MRCCGFTRQTSNPPTPEASAWQAPTLRAVAQRRRNVQRSNGRCTEPANANVLRSTGILPVGPTDILSVVNALSAADCYTLAISGVCSRLVAPRGVNIRGAHSPFARVGVGGLAEANFEQVRPGKV